MAKTLVILNFSPGVPEPYFPTYGNRYSQCINGITSFFNSARGYLKHMDIILFNSTSDEKDIMLKRILPNNVKILYKNLLKDDHILPENVWTHCKKYIKKYNDVIYFNTFIEMCTSEFIQAVMSKNRAIFKTTGNSTGNSVFLDLFSIKSKVILEIIDTWKENMCENKDYAKYIYDMFKSKKYKNVAKLGIKCIDTRIPFKFATPFLTKHTYIYL